MNLLSLIFSFIVFFAIISNSFADEIMKLMLKQLSSKDFNLISNTYLDEYNSVIVSGGNYYVINKDGMKEILNSNEIKNAEKTINSLNINSRSETEDFVTVTYNYEYTAKIGKQSLNGKVEGVAVLLKTEDGYVSIFDAVTQ